MHPEALRCARSFWTALFLASWLASCTAVEDRMLRRAAAQNLGASAESLFADDALRVLICGSSSPLPHPTRAKSCTAIFAAGQLWVVDVGPSSWNRMALWRIPGERIGAVLLTHFHSDHIGELGEWNLQTWVAGRRAPLRVIGPAGVDRVVAGISQAYALDSAYRTTHHGAEFLPPETGRMRAETVVLDAAGGSSVVHDADGLRITAFAVDHEPVSPAVGYRFDWRGRSVVVSGDTAVSANLIAAARGADVLVHDALAPHIIATLAEVAGELGRERAAKVMRDIPDYHASPVEAAQVANQAGVRLLVLSHLVPPPPNRLAARIFTRGVAEARSDPWLLADDGLFVELPLGSTEIETRELE